MKKLLFNAAHPLSESGKPIFIPFGEWNYDGKSRQRLDRAHGEKIANELNARVAKGEPGIPVYQGHPDVPELAAKYPDKGALGWVTKIELANESPDGRAVPGLALTVEWDRDPGKGFRWFSPYWLANERDGSTYIVGTIASIGLVNNPNIPEFRLANEEQPTMKIKLNPAIIELAAKHDRLANEANFDESKHPRAEDGKWTDGGGGGKVDVGQAKEKLGLMLKREAVRSDIGKPGADDIEFEYRGKRYNVGKDNEHMVKQFEDAGLVKRVKPSQPSQKSQPTVADKFKAAAKKAAKDPAAQKFNDALKKARKAKDGAGIARAHMMALKAGMVWDKSIKGYRPPVAK